MVEESEQLASFINTYGATAVVLAVFLTVFLSIMIYILNANKKMMESERQNTEKVLETMLNNFMTNNIKKPVYEEKNIVNIFIELDKVLKTECQETLEKTHSDRTAIYVFHNGTQASHGLPFFKMSCISEKISQNSITNLQLREHTAIPLNLFDKIINGLFFNGKYRIIKDENIDIGDCLFIKNTKLKDCFFYSIYDDENNIMGFIINGYNELDITRDSEKEYKALNELAEKAKLVIQFSKFQDVKDERGD